MKLSLLTAGFICFMFLDNPKKFDLMKLIVRVCSFMEVLESVITHGRNYCTLALKSFKVLLSVLEVYTG